jgi:geranylgeranyl diphosphate synthase, type I
LCGGETSGITKLVKESVSGGRRTRAILAMLWCEAVSGDYREAVPIATAYELAHAAALLEDDIIDGSQRKNSSETFPVKHGIPKTLLVCNTLLFYAPTIVAKYVEAGKDPRSIEKLLELLGECGRLTAEGEFLDLEMRGNNEATESMYERMISMKTGALVGASSASGAVIGCSKVDTALIDAAYSFGESLGMAYQIRDDLLDYFGEEAITGKAPFSDLRNGKKSLPLIHLLNQSNDNEKMWLRELLSGSEPLTFSTGEKVKAMLEKYHSQEYCKQVAFHHLKKAEAVLEKIEKPSEASRRLNELVQYLAIAY